MNNENEDFSFSGLTPDVIANALESVGVDPMSGLLALNSYENRVYQFIADDQRRYVAKFYRPARWTTAQILEEHLFTAELAEAEVPVVTPLQLHGKTLHEYAGYRFTVFPSIGGRAVEPGDLEQLERIGQQIGRLHAVAQQGTFKERLSINRQESVTDALVTLRQSPLLPENLHEAFFAIAEPLAAAVHDVDFKAFAQQRLHGDCHLGNMLIRDQELTFVDFDDARTGPAVQDLWMMLAGDDRHQRALQLDALLSGYEMFCEFDENEAALIEPLRTFRILHYMAWLARRWDDSAFRRAFPWFAEQRYWEQQILTLKEQFAVLQDEPIGAQPNFNR